MIKRRIYSKGVDKMTFWDFIDKYHDDIFLLIFIFGVIGIFMSPLILNGIAAIIDSIKK
jgi:hypothetical protein